MITDTDITWTNRVERFKTKQEDDVVPVFHNYTTEHLLEFFYHLNFGEWL